MKILAGVLVWVQMKTRTLQKDKTCYLSSHIPSLLALPMLGGRCTRQLLSRAVPRQCNQPQVRLPLPLSPRRLPRLNRRATIFRRQNNSSTIGLRDHERLPSESWRTARFTQSMLILANLSPNRLDSVLQERSVAKLSHSTQLRQVTRL